MYYIEKWNSVTTKQWNNVSTWKLNAFLLWHMMYCVCNGGKTISHKVKIDHVFETQMKCSKNQNYWFSIKVILTFKFKTSWTIARKLSLHVLPCCWLEREFAIHWIFDLVPNMSKTLLYLLLIQWNELLLFELHCEWLAISRPSLRMRYENI